MRIRLLAARRSWLLVVLAVVSGIAAAGLLAQHVRTRVQQLEDQSRLPMVERIVAARDMMAGTRLEADDLAVRRFPARWVGSDTLAPAQYLSLQDKVLSTDVQAGNPLLAVHVQPANRAFSDQLAPGRRAVTLPVDQVNSLSGLLQPGDLIDLYVSFDHQRKRLTTPLLQGVQILATGRHTQAMDDDSHQSYNTVTLDAAPEDVIKLVAAQQAGSLTAILRHPADARSDRLAARGDLATLLGVANPPIQSPRRAVILYGSSGARGLPSWARQDTAPKRPGNGWFDMPNQIHLSSAWREEGAVPLSGSMDVDASLVQEPWPEESIPSEMSAGHDALSAAWMGDFE